MARSKQPPSIRRLERQVGKAGRDLARAAVDRHFAALRDAGLPPDGTRQMIYRQTLEMAMRNLLVDDETLRPGPTWDLRQLYVNPDA